jgi:predicted membrane channel-forming protein YqfA (hemolysin III family)
MNRYDYLKLLLIAPLIPLLFYALVVWGCIMPIILIFVAVCGVIVSTINRRKKYGTEAKTKRSMGRGDKNRQA